MNKTSIKVAWRNLLKDKLTTFLNLAGLATGLASAILIYLWIYDEMKVDRFHKNDSRLFQVLKNTETPTGTVTSEPTPGLLAATLAREIPEIEYATPVIPPSGFETKGIIGSEDHPLAAAQEFAGDDFFNVFSYPLIQGDKNHVFPDKYCVAISRELALKLFGTAENIVGRKIEWNQKDYSGLYEVTAVFENPPPASTAQFDIVFSYQLFLDKNPKLQNWADNDPNTYVVLKKGADLRSFNRKIKGLILSRSPQTKSTLIVQKYSDKYLYNHYENGIPTGGRIEYVRLFSIVAVCILIIACINFMNLSTARGERRIKEIGVKKVLGANRAGIVLQYLGESLFLTFMAALIAVGMVMLLLPAFSRITEKNLHIPADPVFFGVLLAIIGVTGVAAGSYPAFYLSGFKPVSVLRGKIIRSVAELFVRKGLVVFQFTLSVGFAISALVIYKQMRLIGTKNLGYNRDNLLYFEKGGLLPDRGDSVATMKYEASLEDLILRVKNTAGVVDAASFRHNITDRDGGTYDISWEGKDPNARIDFTDLAVGYDFIETAGIRMKEGRSFSRSFGDTKAKIIFNQAAIEIMGLKDPVGKIVHLWGEDRQIIGVAENFNFQSLRENLKPCFFDFTQNPRASKVMVRIKPGDAAGTINRLSALYRQYNPGKPFEYCFLDDDYQALYTAEEKVASLSKYFAGITIVISCLGLFGLATFTAQKREKEIGIRKAVGASAVRVIVLLSGEVFKLILLAMLIAFPLSAWLMIKWLNGFAYHVNLGVGVFLLAGLSTVLLACLSIGYRSVRAALTNPIKALKSE